MKVTPFQYDVHVFQPSKQAYVKNVAHVNSLPIAGWKMTRIWTNGEQCISCWKMSWKDRLSALFFGRVWLSVLSGRTQPPACLTVRKRYFRENKPGR